MNKTSLVVAAGGDAVLLAGLKNEELVLAVMLVRCVGFTKVIGELI
ncbi:MAG: hypothetical protein J6582_02820 [Snodgrassella sp.]|nr:MULTISPECIES: hypothetical protein [Snodgrassella]MCO6519957.1 hypothetical protein [Snodgrassella sp.]WMY91262.1 hypothetical protein PYG29_07420 [Snodgrassella communis]